MRIGIDIDVVLNSQYNFCIDYGTKFCNELGKYRLENINAIDTTDMFLWEEVINKLKNDGNLIYIITARKNNDEWFPDFLKKDVEGITKKWLNENKIYYDEIAFDVKDKEKYCKNNNIDIMIEDDPNNLRKLIGTTNVIIFDYPYNRNVEFTDLTRAYSWYDIYYKINYIKEEKNDISNN